MPQLEATAIVPLSPAEAFALAHEVGEARAAWDPAVVASRWLRRATAPAEGAAMFTKSQSGRRRILRFELVDPDRLTSARLVKGQPWLADYGEGLRFEPADSGGTTVTWKIVFKLRSPILARPLGQLIEPSFARELDSRLAGFQRAAAALASSER